MNTWQTAYLDHPLYQPIRAFARLHAGSGWPEQAAYDALLDAARPALPALPANLRFVCDLEPDAYYEMHIGATGEVPTRYGNWHDWFNALAWLAWPQTKQALNERHVRAIERGEVKRGPLRDAATLLDECGVVVAVRNAEWARKLDDMRWQELFVAGRAAWGPDIAVHTLGHAVFEQALAPHIGWCGKALLLEMADAFFELDADAQRARLDEQLAAKLADDAFLPSPRAMCPLPLLGIPGWWPDNEDPAFYDNADYFRPTRRAKSASVSA